MSKFRQPMMALFESADHHGQAPNGFGNVYVNMLPDRPTFVSAQAKRVPFVRSNGNLERKLRAVHQAMLDDSGQRTQNAHRFSGASSQSLNWPKYKPVGHKRSGGGGASAVPAFLRRPVVAGLPLWAVLLGLYVYSRTR